MGEGRGEGQEVRGQGGGGCRGSGVGQGRVFRIGVGWGQGGVGVEAGGWLWWPGSVLFSCLDWVNSQQGAECILGTDLLRQCRATHGWADERISASLHIQPVICEGGW